MTLFLKIVGAIVGVILLIIGGLWLWAAIASRPGPEAGPLTSLTQADFQAAIDSIAAERKLVGMAGKVMVDGAVVAEAATGTRKKDGDTPLTADDYFHVGSIGKSMSATVIATLVEDGRLSWDDTLGERLASVPMHEDWRGVTLGQLLTHTSGVPRAPLSAMFETTDAPGELHVLRREMAAGLLAEPPTTAAGTQFAYSNEGYMLASIMAEEATGEAWKTLVRQRLAGPLGLDTLGFGAPDGPDAPWGHRSVGIAKFPMSPAGADNPPWMAAAGTMHMTLDDLLAYGQAHLDAGREPDAILPPDGFARLHSPVLNDYAMGWVVQTPDLGDGPETILWHNGSNTMWYAVLVLLPERNAAIALATNDGRQLDGTQARFDRLSREIMQAIAGLPEG